MYEHIRKLVDQEHFIDALKLLDPALKDKPESPELNYMMAFCLHNSRIDYRRALQYYSAALEKGYEEFWVRYNRGILYSEMGEIELARSDLREAIKLDPNDPYVRKLLDDVSQQELDTTIKLKSPVIVCSVPKCGTYLLKGILSAVLGEGLVYPNSFASLPLVNENYLLAEPQLGNRLYVGHVFYSKVLDDKLKAVPKILLIRDPRDYVVSQAHFWEKKAAESELEKQFRGIKDQGNKLSAVIFGLYNHQAKLMPLYDTFLNYGIKWMGANTLIVRYEDIIGSQFGGDDKKVMATVKGILQFIGVKMDAKTLAKKISLGADPKRSPTFRVGTKGSWQDEFISSHIEQIKCAAPGLLPALGYETDDNWNIKRNKASIRPPNLEKLGKPAGPPVIRNNPELQQIIDAWVLSLFIEAQQWDSVLPMLSRLLKQDRNNATWNYLYAFTLQMLKKELQEAIRCYGIALQNGYNEFWVRYNRGVLLVSLANYSNALDDLEKALILLPADMKQDFRLQATLHYHLAYCLHLLRLDPKRSLNHYERALEFGFNEFWVRYNRGSLYRDMKEFAAAKADLSKAREIRPNHEGVAKILAEINS